MQQDLLQKNLESLSAHNKGTFDFINKLIRIYKSSNYLVENAKNGEPTLAVLDATGKTLHYHSKYNPVRESQQIVSNSYKQESHSVLIGFGLGYVAEALLEKMPDKAYGPQLFLIEPDPFVFITALKTRDLSSLFSDARVVVFLGIDADSIAETWSAAIDWSVLDGLSIIEHQPSKSRFTAFFSTLLEKMKYLANRSRGNLITLMNVGREFHTNNFMNLPEAFGLPGADRLFEKFKKIPTVIVAAGPSLDKNLELLKKVKGKFLIIAVDTAYRHMLSKGIKPDIVCAADSSYENSLDFVGVEDEKEVILAAELMTHPDIYKVFKGPKMLVTFGGGLYPQIQKMREPVGSLVCWGSVATMAFDLARKIGADPIIFVGFDLSFCEGRLHTKGSYSEDILYEGLHYFTSMENATAEYICERGKFQFVGADGKIIYTDTNMKAYKDWFEDQFKHTEATVINATEGGIVDKFVTKMTFNEVIEKYLSNGINVEKQLQSLITKPVVADYNSLYNLLSSMRNLINDFAEQLKIIWPIFNDLYERLKDVKLSEAKKTDSEKLALVMGLHDRICDNSSVVQWFAALHTKFVTKHTADVINLRQIKDVKIGQWLSVVERLFTNFEEFSLYQIPLIDNALLELRQKYVTIK